MKYKVDYLPRAVKALEKLDKFTRRIILEWIEKNLVDCENPRIHGKPLTADRVGQWRYRIGIYHLTTRLTANSIIVLNVASGLRKEIYK